MTRKASEIFEYAKRKRLSVDEQSFKTLREKSIIAVTEMMKEGGFTTEIDLTDNDMFVIQELTEELRGLGYYYCLIEVQSEEGNIVDHRLRISVAHLDKQ